MATATKTETPTPSAPTPVYLVQQKQLEPPSISVVSLLPTMPKYVVEIHRSDKKDAVDPVYISNGDAEWLLKRGRKVIAPEALVTALQDAVTGVMDTETNLISDVPSFPFSAQRYDGPLPLNTEVTDMRGSKEIT